MKLSLHLRDRKIWLPLAVTLGFFILTVILIFMQSGVGATASPGSIICRHC
jgi:mannitol-specific phosphotransferase system IIBC component